MPSGSGDDDHGHRRPRRVSRLTVYRHFPDERALLAACTETYLEEHPPEAMVAMRGVLMDGWTHSDPDLLRASTGHAIAFGTWNRSPSIRTWGMRGPPG
jgi:AcrR family transcriptional regulator